MGLYVHPGHLHDTVVRGLGPTTHNYHNLVGKENCPVGRNISENPLLWAEGLLEVTPVIPGRPWGVDKIYHPMGNPT